MSVALNLYDNVKRGDALIAHLGDGTSGKLHEWRRSIRAVGGYWMGTGALAGSTDEMLEMFLEGMGRRIVENVGGLTTWEGLAIQMDLTLDGVAYWRNLLPCANAVRVVYGKIGDSLFSDGSAESAAWTQVGTPHTHERVTAWVTKGTYGMHVITDAADEGTQIESGVAIVASAAYMVGVSVRVYSGSWTFAAHRADNDNVLGQSGSSPGFKAVIGGFQANIDGAPSGSTLVYDAGESTEERLVALLAIGNTSVYNATRTANHTATSVNTDTNTITFGSAVPGDWADDDEIYAFLTADNKSLAYAGASGEDSLENRISNEGQAPLYNPTRTANAAITAIDDTNDILTLSIAVSGWLFDDVLGALPSTDRLTFSISEDSAYAGNIYVRLTCDGAGEMYADAATLQRSPYRVETPWSVDEDAADEWGRMEDVLLEAGMTDASATAKAEKEINERAWPRSLPPDQYDVDVGPKEDKLSILFAGYAWTLNYLHLLAGGTDTASNHVTLLVGEAEFVTAGVIESNTLDFQVEESDPMRIWDALEEIIKAGDRLGNRWIGGVYAGRKFDYGPAPTTLSYHYRGGQLLAVHGGPIEPWFALPGLARLDDAPVGPSEITGNIADDPRNVFIEEVEFIAPNELKFRRKV